MSGHLGWSGLHFSFKANHVLCGFITDVLSDGFDFHQRCFCENVLKDLQSNHKAQSVHPKFIVNREILINREILHPYQLMRLESGTLHVFLFSNVL